MLALHQAELEFLEGFFLAHDHWPRTGLAFGPQSFAGSGGRHNRVHRKAAGQLQKDSQAELNHALVIVNFIEIDLGHPIRAGSNNSFEPMPI